MASTLIDFTRPTTMDPSILKGKVALVTGGASGIGLQLALALHAAGAKVTVADLNPPSREDTATELDYIRANVTSWDNQLAAFKQAASHSTSDPETVDIVISAAGIRTQAAYLLPPKPDQEPQKPPIGK